MIDLITKHPDAIQAGFGNTIFYYGVGTHGLSKLPIESEFTLVYSPIQDNGWEAVHYRVLHPDKTYFVMERRDLLSYEIKYFERLLETLSLKRSKDNPSNLEFNLTLAAAY